MTKRQMREIRRGIILANYTIGMPLDMDTKIMLMWSGLPGDPEQDTLCDRAYRRTALRYLQSQGR